MLDQTRSALARGVVGVVLLLISSGLQLFAVHAVMSVSAALIGLVLIGQVFVWLRTLDHDSQELLAAYEATQKKLKPVRTKGMVAIANEVIEAARSSVQWTTKLGKRPTMTFFFRSGEVWLLTDEGRWVEMPDMYLGRGVRSTENGRTPEVDMPPLPDYSEVR